MAATSIAATPPPSPPAGKAHRRRFLVSFGEGDDGKRSGGQERGRDDDAVIVEHMLSDEGVKNLEGVGGGVAVQHARKLLDVAEAACRDAEQTLARAHLKSASTTALFAGTRVTIEISGLDLFDTHVTCAHLSENGKLEEPDAQHNTRAVMRAPIVTNNGQLTDLQAQKLARDRVLPQRFGVLQCVVKFPSLLWQLPHVVPACHLRLPGGGAARGSEGGGEARRGGAVVRLEVRVVSANHLPQMDVLGKVDAYVTLQYAGHRRETTVQSNTYTPIWNETFSFDIATLDASMVAGQDLGKIDIAAQMNDLEMHVMDFDRVGDHDSVGGAVISRARLLDRIYMLLAPQRSMSSGNVDGRTKIHIHKSTPAKSTLFEIEEEDAVNSDGEDILLFRRGQNVVGKDSGLACLRVRLLLHCVAVGTVVDCDDNGAEGVDVQRREQDDKDDASLLQRGEHELFLKGYQVMIRGREATVLMPPLGRSELSRCLQVDSSLQDHILVHGVPLYEQCISLAAVLGPPNPLLGPPPTISNRAQKTFLLLSTGPFPVSKNIGDGRNISSSSRGDAESVVLLSDSSIVDIDVSIDNLSYVAIPQQADLRAKMAGVRVQLLLDLSTETGGGGVCDGGEIIYTTQSGIRGPHPSWQGETCSLALSWGVCKHAVLRFRVLPPPGGKETDAWHLGACEVMLGGVQQDQIYRTTRALSATDDVSGHLQISVLCKSRLETAYGRVCLSSSLTCSPDGEHVPPPLSPRIPDDRNACLAVSWSSEVESGGGLDESDMPIVKRQWTSRKEGAGEAEVEAVPGDVDGAKEVMQKIANVEYKFARKPGSEASEKAKHTRIETEKCGNTANSGLAKIRGGLGPQERESWPDHSKWRIAVHEIVMKLARAGGYHVAFFDGTDGSLLGATCDSR